MVARRAVKIICTGCNTQLYRYSKGGKGGLVKCIEERILVDYTNGDLRCPNPECRQLFARPGWMRGKPIQKIIGGKARLG